MSRADEARRAVAALTGESVAGVRPLGGNVFEVELARGDPVVAKAGAGQDAVPAEAASLAWLIDADAAALPALRGHDERWLVMDRVPAGTPTPEAAERLGRDLADLHDAGAPAFGAPPPGGPTEAWIGLARMRNEPAAEWPGWYACTRVEPFLRAAVDSGELDSSRAAPIAEVCERIDSLTGPQEPPARLHGDLWSGNVLWADDRAWLIDPAAHGGHRETDLAMLALFGCAHSDLVFAAYHDRCPLADGWRDRVPLHQLYPLLVHTVLFGGGYAAQAVAAARKALRAG